MFAPPPAASGTGHLARAAFVAAMRGVASSVTVVTTDGPAGRCGATVSAFCSVSADPPTVLVCLRADSRIARAVAANGAFCVNVLPDSRSDLAERFAGRHDREVVDRFDGVDWEPGSESPVLPGVTAFDCRLSRRSTCGTHAILIGEPMDIRRSAAPPLSWLDGAYHRVERCQAVTGERRPGGGVPCP